MKNIEIGVSKEILYDADFKAIPITIDGAKVTDVDGKKVVKAGTLLKGVGGSAFEDRSLLVEPADPEGDIDGVLLYDVDVTHENREGSLVYNGTLWANKVNGGNVTAEIKEQLNQIKFITE